MSTTIAAPANVRASRIDHLDQLEHRSVHLLREAYASFPQLAMLWSIGKDSTVLLWDVYTRFGKAPVRDEARWAALASEDPAAAHEAVWPIR